MFIKNKSDVDLYAKRIYAYITRAKTKKYVEFVQELFMKNKIEDALNIVIADVYDYFDQLFDKQHEYYDEYYEKTRLEEIVEKIYMLDKVFIEYTIESLKKKKISNINLYYLIKHVLLKLFDVNVNILYAIKYNKNKDANIHIKYIISKYTNAQIKITANLLSKIQVKSKKSVSIDEFYQIYEKHVQNQIEKFETETITKEEIKLTNTDLLVYYYFMSFSKRFVKIKIEEIARDCKISSATASRAIKKLEKAQKIKVHKIKNRNIYEVIDYKEEQQIVKTKKYRDVKNIEITTSESDFKKYKRNEKLDPDIRYKLYLYRQKYAVELQNTNLSRLTKDDALFFLINTEKLVENESLTLQQVLKIIKYADSNHKIENPSAWLISRFMIGRGRFYFLLSKSKLSKLS